VTAATRELGRRGPVLVGGHVVMVRARVPRAARRFEDAFQE
jgi:hypothetical protein